MSVFLLPPLCSHCATSCCRVPWLRQAGGPGAETRACCSHPQPPNFHCQVLHSLPGNWVLCIFSRNMATILGACVPFSRRKETEEVQIAKTPRHFWVLWGQKLWGNAGVFMLVLFPEDLSMMPQQPQERRKFYFNFSPDHHLVVPLQCRGGRVQTI